MEITAGTLYVVGTPIGNLEDMTFRAIDVLKQVDLIAAEDTRHTGKLLHHFQIKTPQISHHEHNRATRIPELIDKLQQGTAIALVTDAGMPCVSDPGYELVKACAAHHIPVVPIPGVTAVITAIAAAGLDSRRFTFEGFLPAKEKERQNALSQLQPENRTMVFYESPHRLRESLASMATVFGASRPLTIARELTKMHEEFWRGTVGEAIAEYAKRDPKGEYTIVVAGAEVVATTVSEADLRQALQRLLGDGLSRSQASKQLAQELNLPKREIYQLSLEL
ncbi:16S rRNA (cytidine(1402)-2'-O)-methyltransferase [filamentous cyanobacterium LEGE 11480]|uniref:Ribosomal RNA small subunit methyltransferase I n=2 Tax=Romeriopsis TaxID=2992131 RepID=A0A928VLS7_9CYAN|nr:16S rRNA (cytidine(1402)-2'-O)-methyltransferase [Romeriopsis navalis LEGE 11480]